MTPRPPQRRRADPVRVLAARMLGTWIRDGAHADRLVQRFEDRQRSAASPWTYDDRRRLRELMFGCVRLKQRYEVLIESRARPGVRIRPVVRGVLWIALHEITELATPPFAAVDQACVAAHELEGPRAVGFVNGLLRAITRDGVETPFPGVEADPLGYAEKWLSHPRWMVDRWAEALGVAETLELCRWNNRRAALTVRTPPRQRESVREEWAAMGWESELCELSEAGLRLATRVPAPLLLEQTSTPVSIQDEAAQLVAPLAAVEGAARVLDLCAAPGGKLFHLAELMPDARIVGADLSAARVERLRENQHRVGRSNVDLVVADGLRGPFRSRSFDAVLLDAPCTGTGVLARRHEARWQRGPDDLQALARLQRDLLDFAVDVARPGGIIVYSTCSLEPEENEAVVEHLVANRPDVEEIGVEDVAPAQVVEAGRLRVWPHRHGTDGAFAARFERRSTT